jgi:hypothetical protein
MKKVVSTSALISNNYSNTSTVYIKQLTSSSVADPVPVSF